VLPGEGEFTIVERNGRAYWSGGPNDGTPVSAAQAAELDERYGLLDRTRPEEQSIPAYGEPTTRQNTDGRYEVSLTVGKKYISEVSDPSLVPLARDALYSQIREDQMMSAFLDPRWQAMFSQGDGRSNTHDQPASRMLDAHQPQQRPPAVPTRREVGVDEHPNRKAVEVRMVDRQSESERDIHHVTVQPDAAPEYGTEALDDMLDHSQQGRPTGGAPRREVQKNKSKRQRIIGAVAVFGVASGVYWTADKVLDFDQPNFAMTIVNGQYLRGIQYAGSIIEIFK
jgi:hypothetical protein